VIVGVECGVRRLGHFARRCNLCGNKVYLVDGVVPLSIHGRLVGAVGVAGLPGGQDEAAAKAGIEAWEKVRAALRK
jgi:uncharacterized protein GlcG (DUF336 family)